LDGTRIGREKVKMARKIGPIKRLRECGNSSWPLPGAVTAERSEESSQHRHFRSSAKILRCAQNDWPCQDSLPPLLQQYALVGLAQTVVHRHEWSKWRKFRHSERSEESSLCRNLGKILRCAQQ
jgi:hypothetical protein